MVLIDRANNQSIILRLLSYGQKQHIDLGDREASEQKAAQRNITMNTLCYLLACDPQGAEKSQCEIHPEDGKVSERTFHKLYIPC